MNNRVRRRIARSSTACLVQLFLIPFSQCFGANIRSSPPTSISMFLSFRKGQTTSPAGHKEHCVQLLLFPQTRKQHIQENHHPFIHHYNFHHLSASRPSSLYPAGPSCTSPQSASGGTEACGARFASRSLPQLLPTSAQPNRIQPQLQLQQVEDPGSNRVTPLPLQRCSLQGRYGQISASVLSSLKC